MTLLDHSACQGPPLGKRAGKQNNPVASWQTVYGVRRPPFGGNTVWGLKNHNGALKEASPVSKTTGAGSVSSALHFLILFVRQPEGKQKR